MLAKQLELSKETISRAMRILADEGAIELKRGIGTVVRDPDRASWAVWTVAIAEEHEGEIGGGFSSSLARAIRHRLLYSGCVDRTFVPPPPPDYLWWMRGIDGFVGLGEAVRAGEIDAIISLVYRDLQDHRDLKDPPVPVCTFGGDLEGNMRGVVIDIRAFVEQAFEELRGRGCRHISLVTAEGGGPRGYGAAGFRAAAARGGQATADRDIVTVTAGMAGGREAADVLLQIAAKDRPDGLVVNEDHTAAGLCRRLREAGDYRPAMAAMTNLQIPLTFVLPVLRFENDVELLGAEMVKKVKDALLDPDSPGSVELIRPKLRAGG